MSPFPGDGVKDLTLCQGQPNLWVGWGGGDNSGVEGDGDGGVDVGDGGVDGMDDGDEGGGGGEFL